MGWRRPILPPAATRPFAAQRLVTLALLCGAWQAGAMLLHDPLMLPSCTATLAAWYRDMASGELPARIWTSIELLVRGYAAGVALAAMLMALTLSSRCGDSLVSTLITAFGPLPGIALLPLAVMWLGLGAPSMILVLAHSVAWPLVLNGRAAFAATPATLLLVGRNYGFGRPRLALWIMMPAALPAVLSGLRIGWAYAWRTLIAAELVFGISSASGGLGWYIFIEKNQLETDGVFAGLLTVVLLGIAMEAGFRIVEARTTGRWGIAAAA